MIHDTTKNTKIPGRYSSEKSQKNKAIWKRERRFANKIINIILLLRMWGACSVIYEGGSPKIICKKLLTLIFTLVGAKK